MKNFVKTPNISDFDKSLKKIKKLKTDEIYQAKNILGKDDKFRVHISRLADRGIIIKTGRGRFYKPSNKTVMKRSDKEIPLDKSLFTNDLFWNVKNGFKIKTDTLLKSYLKNFTQNDLMGLYSLFGYCRLVDESLKLYKSRKDDNYLAIKEQLLQFEKWRMSI